jgi:hypothetical protein
VFFCGLPLAENKGVEPKFQGQGRNLFDPLLDRAEQETAWFGL